MSRKHRSKTDDEIDHSSSSIVDEIFTECEQIKGKILSLATNEQFRRRTLQQQLLDQYSQLILINLDYALEKKIEHDLWTIVFKNEISFQQESIKDNPSKRPEIQVYLQNFYEYARGYYMKLLQDVVQSYNFPTSVCKLVTGKKSSENVQQCKEASIVYFLQHILVHIGDLYRYSNQIDLAKSFYQYSIETIPYLGQPYNQIAILHEMKNPHSLLTFEQNQLITVYYYIRSIAIKVPFPLAISNLEKFFQRFKDNPLDYYERTNELFTLFLQIIAMINAENQFDSITNYIHYFQRMLIKSFNETNFLQMFAIMTFYMHRALGLLPRTSSSKQPQLQFQSLLQLLTAILEQCLETIHLPLSMMVIDEQQLLPLIYLILVYLIQIEKYRNDLFETELLKANSSLWTSLAKLLRSFSVSIQNFQLAEVNSDYPLPEERFFECFLPLNDFLKTYNYKKKFALSEKDQRQLRKIRLVYLLKTLCEKIDEKTKKKTFDHLICTVKDDLVLFEPSIPKASSSAAGDRRASQKSVSDEQRPNVRTPRVTRNVALRQFLEPTDNEQTK